MTATRRLLLAAVLAGGFFKGQARAEEASLPGLSTATLTSEYMEFLSSENKVVARGQAVVLSSGTRLSADELTIYMSSQVVVAVGRAVLVSSGTRLEADHLVLRQTTKEAEAQGHVYLEDQDMTVLGEKARYNWGTSQGVFEHVYIAKGSWRTWGRRLERLGPTVYRIERAAFSSCDQDPPHYHFRARKALFRVRERMSASNLFPVAERTSFFYFPYYTKSLKDNPWTLTVDPGNSARNGFLTKTVFTYPLGPNAKASVKWDYYQRAGNGLGAELSYSSPTARGSVSGFQIKDRIDLRRRWNVRFGHWQRLSARWQVQSHVALQSDETVNDVFVGDDYQRSRQLGESDLALTRTGTWYTARLSVQHDRALDPVQNRFVTSKTVLPQVGFQSSALRIGKTNGYFNIGGNFRNEYDRPEAVAGQPNPIVPGRDHDRQFADGTAGLSWRFPLTKKLSLEPSVGLSETWQSHRISADGLGFDPSDLTQGRGSMGVNLRHRVSTSLDYDIRHRYRVRWSPNSFRRDHASSDHGIDENGLSLFTYYRPSSAVWGRASAGYDLRDTREGLTPYYRNPRQRFISPPTVEVGYAPYRWLSFSGREVVQLYPTRKPQSSILDFRVGKDDRTYFSSAVSYNVSRPGDLDLSNGAAFQLTSGWWLSGDVRTTALGSQKMRYNAVTFKEKNLIVRRDLHCWVARFTYKERPGSHEFYVRLDLKSNFEMRSPSIDEQQFYPARERRGTEPNP